MSRVINTADPGKRRNQCRRTIAEILRHLMFKRRFDEETKDMAAALVFALRGIAESVEATTAAWEKKDYYLKADRFRLEWEWVAPAAKRLEELVLGGHWEKLPQELAALAPHFADIRISKMTRDPSAWKGSYHLLLKEVAESVRPR
jgi:hypothetical protein